MFGQVLDLAWEWHRRGHSPHDDHWEFLVEVVNLAAERWVEPDRGLWEDRSRRQHFVHSKAMAWVAFDRAIRTVEDDNELDGPVDRWRTIRDEIHAEVCDKGFDDELGTFTQTYGSKDLDASLLLLPLFGFLPASDPRMRGTIEAIETRVRRSGKSVSDPMGCHQDGPAPPPGQSLPEDPRFVGRSLPPAWGKDIRPPPCPSSI